jgi:hypothetical protein
MLAVVFLAKRATFRKFIKQIQEGGHPYEAVRLFINNRLLLIH